MASPITFGGLASGLDTNAIVDKLVQVERQPILRLQRQREAENARKALIGELVTKVSTLASKLDALKTHAAVQGRKVDLPSGAPLVAEVQGGAPTGSYSIQVNRLATAQRTYSNTFADAEATGIFTAGTISLSIGASSASIHVTNADSLNSVAQKINASGLRLSAAVVYDGTHYRLVLNGRDTGSANAIHITDPGGTGLGLDNPAHTVVAAQNAQITVDGIVVSSPTNTVSGSIPGVTLTLKATTPEPITLMVAENPDGLKAALKDIASAYNEVMGLLNKQFTNDGKNHPLGPETLAGDSSIRQLQAMLFGMTTLVGGPPGNTFSTLAEIGLTVDRFGVMSLDEARLQRALSTSSTDVANLIAGSDASNGAMRRITEQLKLYTDLVDGVLPNKQKSIDTRIKSIDDDIARMEAAAQAYERRIRQQFIEMEQIIASFQSQSGALAQLSLGGLSGGR
ncbi:MAG: flagellar filament capping protein FliD [Myxococcales bacterium]|nr:flagellar filament capping protein FliD [Myxococcota bacterium]MDW8283341.1 flagellar filament capping protein FliD [Myxococcales bacterium]